MRDTRRRLTQLKYTQLRLSTRKKQHRSNLSFRIGQSGRFHLSLQTRNPNSPVLRANPFPEVTDLFCRLPLPTLFYRPEAFHLGDLLRIWVRLCTKFTHLSSRFSRANASASDGTRPVPLLVVANPISGQTDSRVHTLRRKPLNKKRQLSPKLAPTSLDSIVSPHK